APSTCGAFTSAFRSSSARSAALSPFIAASATSLRPAATFDPTRQHRTIAAEARMVLYFICSSDTPLEHNEPGENFQMRTDPKRTGLLSIVAALLTPS